MKDMTFDQFDQYRLPDGTVVRVDATATNGAAEIDYQLKGGAFVKARLVPPPYTDADGEADAARLTLIDARGRYQRCLIISRAMGEGEARQRYCQTAREQLALAAADVARYDITMAAIDSSTQDVENAYRGGRMA